MTSEVDLGKVMSLISLMKWIGGNLLSLEKWVGDCKRKIMFLSQKVATNTNWFEIL